MKSDLKEQVLAAVPIEVYIGRSVALKKAGSTLKGLCPFHTEKSPSFTVNPEKGFYHCFGCGRGGDLFRFVMESEGMTFPEALNMLARFAGIDTENPTGGRADARGRLIELNEKVRRAFQDFLRSAEGSAFRDYIGERGISETTVENFRLGAAPASWDWLRGRFPDYENDLLKLGLLKRKEEGRSAYDFFRARLIFPIRDTSGGTIAFGGRCLPGDDAGAKYLNSPESPIFHKGSTLYGLHESIREIRSREEPTIVEGYMDVLALHQAGLANACAPLGTALTPDHLRLVGRYTRKLNLVFDGDRAGLQAAIKSARLVLQSGEIQASVLLLPAGKDPCDLALAPGGRVLFEELLPLAVPAGRFLVLETMLPDRYTPAPELDAGDARSFARDASLYYNGKTPERFPKGLEKRPALERLYAALSDFPRPSDQQFLLEEGAAVLGLNARELEKEWEARRRANPPRHPEEQARGRTAPEQRPLGRPLRKTESRLSTRAVRCERALVLELLFHPAQLSERADRIAGIEFLDEHAEFLFRYLEARFLTGNLWTPDSFSTFDLPDDTMAAFSGLVLARLEASREESQGRAGESIRDLLTQLEIVALEKRLEEFDRRYVVADSVEQAHLIEERMRLTSELKALQSRLRGVDAPSH